MAPGRDNEPERTEGITTKMWVSVVLVGVVVLFIVFFTWFRNTANLTPPHNNGDGTSPFSFSGSN